MLELFDIASSGTSKSASTTSSDNRKEKLSSSPASPARPLLKQEFLHQFEIVGMKCLITLDNYVSLFEMTEQVLDILEDIFPEIFDPSYELLQASENDLAVEDVDLLQRLSANQNRTSPRHPSSVSDNSTYSDLISYGNTPVDSNLLPLLKHFTIHLYECQIGVRDDVHNGYLLVHVDSGSVDGRINQSERSSSSPELEVICMEVSDVSLLTAPSNIDVHSKELWIPSKLSLDKCTHASKSERHCSLLDEIVFPMPVKMDIRVEHGTPSTVSIKVHIDAIAMKINAQSREIIWNISNSLIPAMYQKVRSPIINIHLKNH